MPVTGAEKREAPRKGDAVRLEGLENAKELNGTLAVVKSSYASKIVVEVVLTGVQKSVPQKSAVALSPEEEVTHWQNELGRTDPTASHLVVKRLGEVAITVDIMRRTAIGKAVTDMTKRIEAPETGETIKLGKQLVKGWRQMYAMEKASEDGSHKNPAIEASQQRADQGSSKNTRATSAPTSGADQGSVKNTSAVSSPSSGAAAATGESITKGFNWRKLQAPEKASSKETGKALEKASSKVASAKTPVPVAADRTSRGDAAGVSQKCMARIWNQGRGGQCEKRRFGRFDLCEPHKRLLDVEGRLPYGRVDDEKKKDNGKGSSSVQVVQDEEEQTLDAIEAFRSTHDAQRMVKQMRSITLDEMRMSVLTALDSSSRATLGALADAEGLLVLDQWIRLHSKNVAYACLTVLQKIPATATHLKASRITATLTSLAKGELSLFQSDRDALMDCETKAGAVLEKWRREGLLKRTLKTEPEVVVVDPQHASTSINIEEDPPVHSDVRHRKLRTGMTVRIHGLSGASHLNGEHGVLGKFDLPRGRWPVRLSNREIKNLKASNIVAVNSSESNLQEPEATKAESTPAERTPAPPTKRARIEMEIPETAPPELQTPGFIDERIRAAIVQDPKLLDFMAKHRWVLQNMNSDNVDFLRRNLARSTKRKDNDLESPDVPTVNSEASFVLFDLDPTATEEDVWRMCEDHGVQPTSILIPRESSKRHRSCRTGFVNVASAAQVAEALRVLPGVDFMGRPVCIELPTGESASMQRMGQRVKWGKVLWDVATFNREDTAKQIDQRHGDGSSKDVAVRSADKEVYEAQHVAVKAEFQAALKREHDEEKRLMQEAFTIDG